MAAPAPYSGGITPNMRAEAILNRYRSPPSATAPAATGSSGSSGSSAARPSTHVSSSGGGSRIGHDSSAYLSRSAHVAAALEAASQARLESPQRSRAAPYISTSYFVSPTAAAATSRDATPASPARMRSMLDRPGFSASSVPLSTTAPSAAALSTTGYTGGSSSSSGGSGRLTSATGAAVTPLTQLKSPARLVAELQALRAQAMALSGGSNGASEPYRSIFAASTSPSANHTGQPSATPSASSASTIAATAPAASVLTPSRTAEPLPLSFSPLKFMLPFRSSVPTTPILSPAAAAAAARIAAAEAAALHSAELRFRSPVSSALTQAAPASAPTYSSAPALAASSSYEPRRSAASSATTHLSPAPSTSPSSSHLLSLSSPSSLLPYRPSLASLQDESEAIVRKYRVKLLLAATTPEQSVLAGQVGSTFGHSPLQREERQQQQGHEQEHRQQQQLQQPNESPSRFAAASSYSPSTSVSTDLSSFSASIRARYASPSVLRDANTAHKSPRAPSATASPRETDDEGRVAGDQRSADPLDGAAQHVEHGLLEDDEEHGEQVAEEESDMYEEENAEEHIHVTVTRFQQPSPQARPPSPLRELLESSSRTPPPSQPRSVISTGPGRHSVPRTSPRRALLDHDEDDADTDSEPVRRSLDASFSSVVGDAAHADEGQQQQQQQQQAASVFRHSMPSPLPSDPSHSMPSSEQLRQQQSRPVKYSPSSVASFLLGTGLDKQPSAEVLQRNREVDAARAAEIAALASSAVEPPEMSESEFEQLVAPWQRGIELDIEENDEDEMGSAAASAAAAEADATAAEGAEREREQAKAAEAQTADADQRRSDALLAAAWSRDTAAEMAAESVGVPADKHIPFLGSGAHAAGAGAAAQPDVLTTEQRVQLAALQQSYDASSPLTASPSRSAEASPSLGSRVQPQINGVDPNPLASHLRHAEVSALRLAGAADVLGFGGDASGGSELMRLRAAVNAIQVPLAQGLGPWSSFSSQQPSPAATPHSLLDELHPLTHLAHHPAAPEPAVHATEPPPPVSFSHSLTRTSRNRDEQDWSRLKQLRSSPHRIPVDDGEGDTSANASAAASASMSPHTSPQASPVEAPFPIHPFAPSHDNRADEHDLLADGDRNASAHSHPSLSRLSSANRTEYSVAGGSGSHSPVRSSREPGLSPVEYGLRLSSPSKHSLADPHPEPLFMHARGHPTQSDDQRQSDDGLPPASHPHGQEQRQADEDHSETSPSRQSSSAHVSRIEEWQESEREMAAQQAMSASAANTANAAVAAVTSADSSSGSSDSQLVVESILLNYRSSGAVMAAAVAASQSQASASQDALAQMKEAQQSQLARVRDKLADALGLQPHQVDLWHARERRESPRSHGDEGGTSSQLAAFDRELDSSLSLFHRAPRHAFHPQSLRRFGDLILALLRDCAPSGVLDAEVAQALHAALQGIATAMRQDCGADDEDDGEETPLSREERAQVDRMDLSAFAAQCPLPLRLSLLNEWMSLLHDESSHTLIVAQLSASYAGETALLHATHTEHTRRLTEEIIAEVQTLQRERAANLTQLHAERRRRLDAIAGAARPSHTPESPRQAGRADPSPAAMELLLSRSSSRDDAFPVHRLPTDERDHGTHDHDEEDAGGDFDTLEPQPNGTYQESEESDENEEERLREAAEDAAELEELFPAEADHANGYGDAGDVSESGSDASGGAFDAFEEDADGFATVVLRDGTDAVRFDQHATDESDGEEESDTHSEDDDSQLNRDAQSDADEFPDLDALPSAQQDDHVEQSRHADSSSRPAPIGQLHGGDVSDSSSEEEEEEEEEEDSKEEDEAEEGEEREHRGDDSTDSIIDRIMRHHHERAQPHSTGPRAAPTTTTTTMSSSSGILSFARNVSISSSGVVAPASSSAPDSSDFVALRSLLEVGVESSLARLREKAAARMAQAAQEQREMRQHEVELEDLMQLTSMPEAQPNTRAHHAQADHAVHSDRHTYSHADPSAAAPDSTWSDAHSDDEWREEASDVMHHDQAQDEDGESRRLSSSSDEDDEQSGGHSDASDPWQRKEMQQDEEDEDASEGPLFFNQPNDDEQTTHEAHEEDASLPSRARAYAASSESTAADSGAPSAAASRQGLLMSLRERVDEHAAGATAAARDRPTTSRGRPAPTLASFTAGAATSAGADADPGDPELQSTSLFYSSSSALSFLRIDPARTRHLQQQFAREQRSFDERHEPTAVPDPDLQTIPPAEGRDDLDPSNFRS